MAGSLTSLTTESETAPFPCELGYSPIWPWLWDLGDAKPLPRDLGGAKPACALGNSPADLGKDLEEVSASSNAQTRVQGYTDPDKSGKHDATKGN